MASCRGGVDITFSGRSPTALQEYIRVVAIVAEFIHKTQYDKSGQHNAMWTTWVSIIMSSRNQLNCRTKIETGIKVKNCKLSKSSTEGLEREIVPYGGNTYLTTH